jgi:hypothetical protein
VRSKKKKKKWFQKTHLLPWALWDKASHTMFSVLWRSRLSSWTTSELAAQEQELQPPLLTHAQKCIYLDLDIYLSRER